MLMKVYSKLATITMCHR